MNIVWIWHVFYSQSQPNGTLLANECMRCPRVKQYGDGTIVYRKRTRHHWSSLRDTLKGGVMHLSQFEVSDFAILILLTRRLYLLRRHGEIMCEVSKLSAVVAWEQIWAHPLLRHPNLLLALWRNRRPSHSLWLWLLRWPISPLLLWWPVHRLVLEGGSLWPRLH